MPLLSNQRSFFFINLKRSSCHHSTMTIEKVRLINLWNHSDMAIFEVFATKVDRSALDSFFSDIGDWLSQNFPRAFPVYSRSSSTEDALLSLQNCMYLTMTEIFENVVVQFPITFDRGWQIIDIIIRYFSRDTSKLMCGFLVYIIEQPYTHTML